MLTLTALNKKCRHVSEVGPFFSSNMVQKRESCSNQPCPYCVVSSCDTGCVAAPVRGSPQEGGAGWEAGD